MTGAGPTGGDERIEAAARLTDDNLASLAIELTADPDDYVYGPTVLAAVVELRERRAADAVAAQDPAPRAEPALWEVLDRDGKRWDTATFEFVAEREAAKIGGTVVPLYRDPAPAPVVPDEADQATAEVDYISDEGTAHRVTINGTTWRSGPEETAEDLRREVQAHAALLSARLVPPTGGDR